MTFPRFSRQPNETQMVLPNIQEQIEEEHGPNPHINAFESLKTKRVTINTAILTCRRQWCRSWVWKCLRWRKQGKTETKISRSVKKKKKLCRCCSSNCPCCCSLWKSKNDLLWQEIKEIFLLILIINLWDFEEEKRGGGAWTLPHFRFSGGTLSPHYFFFSFSFVDVKCKLTLYTSSAVSLWTAWSRWRAS